MIHLAAGLPVIGAIEAMPAAREALEKAPRDRRLPEELIEALAQGFWKHADAEAIRELARSRPFPEQADLSCLDRSRSPLPGFPRGLRPGRGFRPLLSRYARSARSTGGRTGRVLAVA